MNWRIVVAVIVAFVIGGAAGGFAERERVSNDRSKTTTPSAVTTDWFGSKKASACPALKRWSVGAAATYKALGSKGAWTATRTSASKPISAMTASYRAMVPAANSAGKGELQFLITYQNQLSTALKQASSLAAYRQARGKLHSARLTRDIGIVSNAAKSCPKV